MSKTRTAAAGGYANAADLFKYQYGTPLGNLFYVHHTGTDSAGRGRSPDSPVATIDYAVGLCTANNDDVILAMPGHVEDLSDTVGIDIDVAGVTVVGLGEGGRVPQIHYNHATAAFDVGASGCKVKNFRLLPSVTAVAIGIDVEAAVTDTILEDIEILPGEDGAGVDEFVLGIDIKAGCSRTVIRRLKVRQHASAAGCDAGISLTGASDDVLVEDCDIVVLGTAGVAPIKGITTLSTNVRIRRCLLVSDNEPGIELLTGTTGVLEENRIFSDLGTIAAAIVADGCARFLNLYVEVAPEREVAVGTASADD